MFFRMSYSSGNWDHHQSYSVRLWSWQGNCRSHGWVLCRCQRWMRRTACQSRRL